MMRRGPGLVGMAARTAVVAGTATAVSGRVARRQQSKYASQDAAYVQQQASAAEAGYEQQAAGFQRCGNLFKHGRIFRNVLEDVEEKDHVPAVGPGVLQQIGLMQGDARGDDAGRKVERLRG